MFEGSRYVRFYRIGRAVDGERSTLMMTGFDDLAALEAYRSEPLHVAASARAAQLRKGDIVQINASTTDPTEVLTFCCAGAPRR